MRLGVSVAPGPLKRSSPTPSPDPSLNAVRIAIIALLTPNPVTDKTMRSSACEASDVELRNVVLQGGEDHVALQGGSFFWDARALDSSCKTLNPKAPTLRGPSGVQLTLKLMCYRSASMADL